MQSGLFSPTEMHVVRNLDFTSTGDKGDVCFGRKVEIMRTLVYLNAAPGDTGTIKLDKRPTYGSDTSRGDGDVAVIELLTTHAAGAVVYDDFATSVTVAADEQVVIEASASAASVSACTVVILFREIPEVAGNNSVLVAST